MLNGFLSILFALNGFLNILFALNGFLITLFALNGFLNILFALNGFLITLPALNGFLSILFTWNDFLLFHLRHRLSLRVRAIGVGKEGKVIDIRSIGRCSLRSCSETLCPFRIIDFVRVPRLEGCDKVKHFRERLQLLLERSRLFPLQNGFFALASLPRQLAQKQEGNNVADSRHVIGEDHGAVLTAVDGGEKRSASIAVGGEFLSLRFPMNQRGETCRTLLLLQSQRSQAGTPGVPHAA